jgi:prepilin-type N-terminal cleavage/methylation domain-containing protein
MKKNKKGFTLIELMVVIAIIAILATVVLVALQSARTAANDAKMKSSVAQLRSLAETHYAADQNYAGFVSDTETMLLTAQDNVSAYVGDSLTAGNDMLWCAIAKLNEGWFCADNDSSPDDVDSETCTSASVSCE